MLVFNSSNVYKYTSRNVTNTPLKMLPSVKSNVVTTLL